MIDSHELRRRDGTPQHDQRTAYAIRIISQLRFLFECYGAYSHRKYYVCKAVISTYELRDVVDNVRKVDPKVLINTYNTVNFYGNFYQKPLE